MPRPQNRLTDRTLRNLKPEARPYDLADGGGLCVRVERTGSIVFWLRYQLAGARRRWVLGHYGAAGISLTEARDKRDAARRLLRQGLDPREHELAEKDARTQARIEHQRTQQRQSRTVGWLIDQFCRLELPVQHKRPQWGTQLLRQHVEQPLGALSLGALSAAHVWQCLDPIRIGHPATARHVYGLLRKLFAFGVQRGHLTQNPVSEIERQQVAKKPPSRTRVLSDAEIRYLWLDFGDGRVTRPVWLALRLLLATGQRRGELTRATWIEFDFAARTWLIPPERLGKKKNTARPAVPHLVPLSGLALELLAELKALAGASDWVLPSPQDGKKSIDLRALTRAVARKAQGWTPHDLRRTCRTRLAALGVTATVAERVIGHELPELLQVYDVYAYAQEKREALERWAAELRRIVGERV